MLILTKHMEEFIKLNVAAIITLLDIKDNRVRLGIEVPQKASISHKIISVRKIVEALI